MRLFPAVGVVAVLASIAHAAVWVTPYRCDEATPLVAPDPNEPTVYHDIMVGTHLVLVVSSDSDTSWTGALYTSGGNSGHSLLLARGYFPLYDSYTESCLDAAGWGSMVSDYWGMNNGFVLSTAPNYGVSGWDPVAGDWFIFDYDAGTVGSCDVVLYDYSRRREAEVLVETLSFSHVASRDFNGDNLVDFKDFAILSSHWRATVEPDPNNPNAGLDLNSDRQIDAQDLALFGEYWLERTDYTEPAADSNDSTIQS